LTVVLRSARGKAAPPPGLVLDFPDVEPADAKLREGALAIDVEPVYQATVLQSSQPPAALEGDEPWGRTPPNYAYAYRGKAVTGRLRVVPRRPRFHARSSAEVLVAAGRATLSLRLEVEPTVGSLDALDLYLSAPTGGRWKWSSEGDAG